MTNLHLQNVSIHRNSHKNLLLNEVIERIYLKYRSPDFFLVRCNCRRTYLLINISLSYSFAESTYHHDKESQASSDFIIDPRKLCETNSTWIRPRLAKNYKGKSLKGCFFIGNPCFILFNTQCVKKGICSIPVLR